MWLCGFAKEDSDGLLIHDLMSLSTTHADTLCVVLFIRCAVLPEVSGRADDPWCIWAGFVDTCGTIYYLGTKAV